MACTPGWENINAARTVLSEVSYRLADHDLAPVLQALYDWGSKIAERDGVDIRPATRR